MVDITDWNDLDAAIQGTNGSEDTGDYVLQNDLDSDTAGYSGIGDSWQPCGLNATGDFATGFQGTFDGNGFEIRDLVIDDNSHDTSEDRIGLFGDTEGGDGTTIIENLGVRGTIDRSSSGTEAGLIVGLSSDINELRNCYAAGSVDASSMQRVGGVSGRNGATIANCYSLVAVIADGETGGLCGANNATIQTSYSAGSVTGSTDVGGFTGLADTETDCYWDTEASGQSTSAGSATGLTTSEMQGSSAETNLSGFDFSGTWDTVVAGESNGDVIPDSDGYAILQANDTRNQLDAQNITLTAVAGTLTGTITQSGSGVENAYVFAYTVPSNQAVGTTTTDASGNYSLDIPEDGTPPFEVAVGVDFDDGTDRFGRAKTVLFDP